MSTSVILPADPRFPPTLHDLPRGKLAPCPALHVRGVWPQRPGVAIVGTRQPTKEAVDFTRTLAAAAVRAGWAVWSGGALGIDAAAHEGALDHGGATVVVCPSGLDVTYPPEHDELFRRVVASGGTLVSRFADDVQPHQGRFHKRNELLACLTFASVVVQAPLRSGARSTARAARKLGRPLYVVPHAPWDPIGAGCARELIDGARPIVRADDVIEQLVQLGLFAARTPRDDTSSEPAPSPAGARHADTLYAGASHARGAPACSEHAARVLEAVGEMPVHADDLCERTGLPFATVSAALLTLTLQAVVVEAPAGFYRRPSP